MLLQQVIAHLRRGASAHRLGWGRKPDPFGRGEHLVIRDGVICHCPGATAKPRPWAARVADLLADDWAVYQPCTRCEPGVGQER